MVANDPAQLLCGPLSPCLSVLGYIDPGTGSFLLQIFAASLFGAMFYFKQYWHQIKAMVAKVTKNG